MHSAVSLVVKCSRKHVSSRRHLVPFVVLPSTASLFFKMRSMLIANPAMSTGTGLYIMCAHVCVCVCVCVSECAACEVLASYPGSFILWF